MAERACSSRQYRTDTEANAVHLDRRQLGAGRAVRVAAVHPRRTACLLRSDPAANGGDRQPRIAAELPDGEVGEIWLHGNNIGRAYWARTQETQLVFGNKLQSATQRGSHANGSPMGALGSGPAI